VESRLQDGLDSLGLNRPNGSVNYGYDALNRITSASTLGTACTIKAGGTLNWASTYTVDASSATVLKGDVTGKPAASTFSAVAVGDTVMVDGTVSGTSVTAKMIIDGPMPKIGDHGQGQAPADAGNTTTTTTQ